jgi:hypothetical protein
MDELLMRLLDSDAPRKVTSIFSNFFRPKKICGYKAKRKPQLRQSLPPATAIYSLVAGRIVVPWL